MSNKPIYKLHHYFLTKDIDNYDKWAFLSKNPKAIEILKQNYENINWYALSMNESYEAMELLKENKKEIDWYYLSSNPFAI